MCLKYPYVIGYIPVLYNYSVYVFNSLIVKKKAQFMLSAPALYHALHSKKFSDTEELWHEIENKKAQLNYL